MCLSLSCKLAAVFCLLVVGSLFPICPAQPTTTATMTATTTTMCPPGFYARFFPVPKCEQCSRGHYCPGGTITQARRIPCPIGLTTLAYGANSEYQCLCDRGRRQVASDFCPLCDVGYYQETIGNVRQCTQCPGNATTFSRGSTDISACFCGKGMRLIPGEGESISCQVQGDVYSGDLSSDQSVEADAVIFGMDIAGISLGTSSEDEEMSAERSLQRLMSIIRSTIAGSLFVRIGAIAISVEIVEANQHNITTQPNSSLREEQPSSRMQGIQTQLRVQITVRTKGVASAAQLREDILSYPLEDDLTEALVTDASFGTSNSVSAILSEAPHIGSSEVRCFPGYAVPPGAALVEVVECECDIGYGLNKATGDCVPCKRGEYKSTVGLVTCDQCPARTMTLAEGSKGADQCVMTTTSKTTTTARTAAGEDDGGKASNSEDESMTDTATSRTINYFIVSGLILLTAFIRL